MELLSDKTSLPEITRGEREALIRRISTSQVFRRAVRLREFLLFLNNRDAEDFAEPLREGDIGHAVFQRAVGYDTVIDNIVRVSATDLRKRLALYFSTEGANEVLGVEIPRGIYELRFFPRNSVQTAERDASNERVDQLTERELEAEAAHLTELDTDPEALATTWTFRWGWPVLSLSLLALCVGLYLHDRSLSRRLEPWRLAPATKALWADFFSNGLDTDIVVGDTSLTTIELIEHQDVSLRSYVDKDYLHVSGNINPDNAQLITELATRKNGSIGDFLVARRLIQLNPTKLGVHVRFARDYYTEALKLNNVVLIGSRVSDPWVELFENRMNFRIAPNSAHEVLEVHNSAPQQGEKTVYAVSPESSGVKAEGYSIVAFQPNLNRTGHVLILEGTDSQATRAAGEFVVNEKFLGGFLKEHGIPVDRPLPPFEVLLHSQQLTGTPFRSEVVAFRISKP